MKILLSGGGTAGSIMPLIALKEGLSKKSWQTDFLLIGTKNGPERELCQYYGIPFRPINTGKFRRYFSINNFIDPFKIISGYFEAKKILKVFDPDIVVSAGGFVAVPVSRAAYKLKIPVVIHQQDVIKGLANRLIEKYADLITVNFETSRKDFNAKKTRAIGNPIRPDIIKGDAETARQIFNLNT